MTATKSLAPACVLLLRLVVANARRCVVRVHCCATSSRKRARGIDRTRGHLSHMLAHVHDRCMATDVPAHYYMDRRQVHDKDLVIHMCALQGVATCAIARLAGALARPRMRASRLLEKARGQERRRVLCLLLAVLGSCTDSRAELSSSAFLVPSGLRIPGPFALPRDSGPVDFGQERKWYQANASKECKYRRTVLYCKVVL